MAKEIERKFLVDPKKLPPLHHPLRIRQGYLPGCQTGTVRVRISNEEAFLTLKGRTTGITRSEFEYPVPLSDAEQMLTELCSSHFIEKERYLVPHEGHLWEIDIFSGKNSGLIVAEIEFSEENEAFAKPEWVTTEVSSDPKYRNVNLLAYPYCDWEA
ncbi:hypothetical protein MNB_SV-10-164 [hydrothermal vent metagenome]|uniref:CYTH domain-containing protein n=1 Tax=hydrothermal vent metagenome TaxID=652676 RepID=A0A1W1CUM9_9ZZZZ